MNIMINRVQVVVDTEMTKELAAARELLRQRAISIGLLDAAIADRASIDQAFEELLAREVITPTPTDDECRRYYDNHRQEFQSGDLACVRHILFQVTPSVRVPEIRARAEQTLNELLRQPERFDAVARELSNCPSGQHGGNLGQISRGDTVPEFERAVFRLAPTGILRELVKTRYGFHVVAVDKYIPGRTSPFEAVREQILEKLKVSVEEHALRQYVSILAGRAQVAGADFESAETPLVQ
jgi:peptidyl-prolyl cis-trans isomerase C